MVIVESLGDATEAIYTIRGPWSSPVVEPVNSITDSPNADAAEGINQDAKNDSEVNEDKKDGTQE